MRYNWVARTLRLSLGSQIDFSTLFDAFHSVVSLRCRFRNQLQTKPRHPTYGTKCPTQVLAAPAPRPSLSPFARDTAVPGRHLLLLYVATSALASPLCHCRWTALTWRPAHTSQALTTPPRSVFEPSPAPLLSTPARPGPRPCRPTARTRLLFRI